MGFGLEALVGEVTRRKEEIGSAIGESQIRKIWKEVSRAIAMEMLSGKVRSVWIRYTAPSGCRPANARLRSPRERWQDGIRMVQCVNLPSLGTFSVVNVGRPDGIRFAVRQLHAVARPFVRSWGGLARRRYPMFEPSALFCTTYGLVPKARASEPLLAVPHTAPTVMLNMQARVSPVRAQRYSVCAQLALSYRRACHTQRAPTPARSTACCACC